MAKEVIATSILMIATVVAVSVFITFALPTISSLGHTYSSVAESLNEKVSTDVEIIFIRVTNNSGVLTLDFWVKNLGSKNFDSATIEMSDIFITSSNRYLHYSLSDSLASYTVQNGDGDSFWEKGETLRVTLSGISAEEMPSDKYLLTLVLYNGFRTSDYFSW